MEIRFLVNGKLHAVRTDLTDVPREGDRVVLRDDNDNDYIVDSVGWDLFDMNKSAAVVDLKPMKIKR